MKGTIHYCLEETIKSKYGDTTWNECLKAMDLELDHTFGKSILQDLDEQDSIELFTASAKVLGIELKTLFDDFGDYWCCEYAPKMYPQFFEKANSTKELLLGLDQIHQIVTSKKPGAKPPRFKYDWQDDGKLLVEYQSQRGLFELFESLLKGLGKYFNDKTIIERPADNKVLLSFQ